MQETIQGAFVEARMGLSGEQIQECYERVNELAPPEELQRSLAKLAVQLALEPNFTANNHVTCALPKEGFSWFALLKKVHRQKFWDGKGFDAAQYEIEAICQDVDEIIWGEV